MKSFKWAVAGLAGMALVTGCKGFWDPLFEVFGHIHAQNLIPEEFRETWRSVDRVEDILPALREMPTTAFTASTGIEEMT